MVKRREPWLVVVLVVLTQGWFWFYWAWRVNAELARERGAPFKAGPRSAVALALALATRLLLLEMGRRAGERPLGLRLTEFTGVYDALDVVPVRALALAAILLAAAFAAWEAWYLWDGVTMLEASAHDTLRWRVMATAGWLLFGLGAILSTIGFASFADGTPAADAAGITALVAVVASSVVLIVWIVHVQRQVNRMADEAPSVVPTTG
ncbi:MAG: hypothetical protein HYT80_04785 [Euryarchaeota archaeon]|nr:hypothetical protein [Euryarchaeota archaeon]